MKIEILSLNGDTTAIIHPAVYDTPDIQDIKIWMYVRGYQFIFDGVSCTNSLGEIMEGRVNQKTVNEFNAMLYPAGLDIQKVCNILPVLAFLVLNKIIWTKSRMNSILPK